LVNLKKYSFTDLAEFGDLLSLFMMIDKIKSAEEFDEIGKLPKEYSERLNNMNVPPHLMELLVKVITVLLRKIDVPQDEVDEFLERIDERGVAEMLAIADYNVQETRRLAKEESDRRAEEERSKAEEERRRAEEADRRAEEERSRAEEERSRAEEERSRAEEERSRAEEADRRAEEERSRAEEERSRADKSEFLLKSAVKLLIDQGNTATEIATKMRISEQHIMGLVV